MVRLLLYRLHTLVRLPPANEWSLLSLSCLIARLVPLFLVFCIDRSAKVEDVGKEEDKVCETREGEVREYPSVLEHVSAHLLESVLTDVLRVEAKLVAQVQESSGSDEDRLQSVSA